MFRLSKSNNLNLSDLYEKAENLISSVPFVKKRIRRRRFFNLLNVKSIEIIKKTKMVVQIAPMMDPAGVHGGRLIVLYQAMPDDVNVLPM